jgi:hypothetical protein
VTTALISREKDRDERSSWVAEIGWTLIILAAVLILVDSLRRQRKRAADVDLEDRSWLRAQIPDEIDPKTRHAPVAEFHVSGQEAQVVFDVPLPEEDDEVLNGILMDEAYEVVREKRSTLPIDDVTAIVVLAGRGKVREVGRAQLSAPGELPEPVQGEMLNLTHVAKDPFARQFEVDHSVMYETQVTVPQDDLGPWQAELRVPAGLQRGMRARGIDPSALSGPDFVLAVLEMFNYSVKPLPEANTYMAIKDGVQLFIRNEAHGPGQHPELDESVIRKFVVEFSSSGATYGMLISDKYGPFMMHDIETRDPRIRFITRERGQGFIDSMALS